MKKKIVLLTNESVHHHYFIKKIFKKNLDLHIFLETKKLKNKFQTYHPIDGLMEKFEKKIWFKNTYQKIEKKYVVLKFKDFNLPKCIQKIKKINPDFIISFGSSYLKNNFFFNFKYKVFNFHGGDPTLYRGLDSHLWSIYHNDYKNFTVVLHKVDKSLDTGNIIYKKKISTKKLKYFKQLRVLNTEICIKLFNKFCKNFKNIKSYKQRKVGRYYSSMPSVLKSFILEKFETRFKNK